MNFDYNSTRGKLILSEYGRNVQNMVAYICTLPTKEERNRYAQVVIDLMGFLNPHLRDVADFKHKLWDHLHIISDFKIDVDAPYPLPVPGAIRSKPEILAYPQQRIRYKHYGKTVEKMIAKALELEDDAQKQQMSQSIANFMKMAYVTWNKDSVTDEKILDDLKEFSHGELKLDETVNLAKVDFKSPSTGTRTKGGSHQNQHKSRGTGGRAQTNAGGTKKRMNTKRY
jgi:hypothetical protein